MDSPLIFAGRYQKLTAHKKGGTAQIYKALDLETHSLVALKVFHKSAIDPAILDVMWDRERSALAALNHPSIVRMLDAGRDESTNERFIALEWIDGVTLEDYLKNALSWDEFSTRVGRKLLDAVCYAARRNIAHRDLSPNNILVTPNGDIKVVDFAQAKLEAIGIGLTVMSFKTAPYCLPEEDNGTFTQTRDPYAFSAIAVRALAGKRLADHEQLYNALAEVELPAQVRPVLEKALNREPKERYPTIIDFDAALESQKCEAYESAELIIPYRLDPNVAEQFQEVDTLDGTGDDQSVLLRELNDFVSLTAANDQSHLSLETQSFKLVAKRDASAHDHLVIVRMIRKHFKVDSLYGVDRWHPNALFSTDLPRRPEDRKRSRIALDRLYELLEEFLQETSRSSGRSREDAFSNWSNLLEAMRYLASTSVPEVRYSEPVKEGARLIVKVENPENLSVEEFRTISINDSWVFRGEVESIQGNLCVLVASRNRVDLERIPQTGSLEIDWRQTRIALDRQGRALEKFKNSETPNHKLANLLTGVEHGDDEAKYGHVPKFFDPMLDESKRLITAQDATCSDLIVAHGPPGTGKTKLIVELIRQALSRNSDARILLASQTHVALDNALERLLNADANVSCVRIGSGTREASPSVVRTSIEERSAELRDRVTRSAQDFILTRARSLGVDRTEVELGLAAMGLVNAQEHQSKHQAARNELNRQKAELQAALELDAQQTSDLQGLTVQANELEEALTESAEELKILETSVQRAKDKLSNLGPDGRALSKQTPTELREWAHVLAHDDPHKQNIGNLIQLSEAWRLRFTQSDDFKAAIIASSSVVAGTCVGFCREEAAARTAFDVCIVDEAAKATTTELLVPLAQARRAVLFGDHHQLPAILDHQFKSTALLSRFNVTKQQVNEQLFERLTQELRPGSLAVLETQHRMRGEIGRLVSECFYDGKLLEGESIRERTPLDLSHAGLTTEVTWLNPYQETLKGSMERPKGTSFDNYVEAEAIVVLLRRILFAVENSRLKQTPTIGIISGYAPQAALIQNLIRKDKDLDRLNTECASVHSFQGREVDICIYTVTRRNAEGTLGMIKDWRHLNVALSRARDYLVIVGDHEFCRQANPPNRFPRVVSFIEQSPLCVLKGATA